MLRPITPQFCILPPDIENTLLRICQESLTNVKKHAQASQAEINLAFEGKIVRLSIQDNGINGVYHSVSPKYLQLYLNEYAFRYNHRKAKVPMFKALGRALDKATRIDEHILGELPSTKEFLEG